VKTAKLINVKEFSCKFSRPLMNLYVEFIKNKGENMTATSNKLRRSRSNRVIAGVCGGLGEFFGISAFWFRLLFLILLLPGGLPGLVPYLILWIVVPKARR
jgi:phage shock protein C